ncbi:MAG: type II toxin-antitoxin system Phd/YefM family antitoxin [Acidiferrobacterales bacterium]
MGKRWQLQDAKNQLSRVVAEARRHGPQTITVHGAPAAVVVSVEKFRELSQPPETLTEFFRHSPLAGTRLKVRRVKDTGRPRVRL